MNDQEWADRMNQEAQGVYSFCIIPMYDFIKNPAMQTACITWVHKLLTDKYVCCLLCEARVGPDYRVAGAVTLLQAHEHATAGTVSTICAECMSELTFSEAFDKAFKITTAVFGMDDAKLIQIHESVGRA
jgi:hypothetical protein